MKRIKSLISVCQARNQDKWVYVSRNILKYIDCETYTLIVPASDLATFEAISPPGFNIVDEDSLLAGFTLDSVRRRMPETNKRRAGWYFQQILKILALKTLPSAADDILLLWDADTIPLKPLSFRAPDGRLAYYVSAEFHPPYFEALERLLGLKRTTSFSFIAQSFPLYRGWIDEFTAAIEAYAGDAWIDAILSNTDLAETSGFSEYETLGAFLLNTHRSEVTINMDRWERLGHFRGLDLKTLSQSETLGREFAYVAFEAWDRPGAADG